MRSIDVIHFIVTAGAVKWLYKNGIDVLHSIVTAGQKLRLYKIAINITQFIATAGGWIKDCIRKELM